MDQDTKSIYRPRRPERIDLHLAVRENLQLSCDTYDERFLDQHGPLTARTAHTGRVSALRGSLLLCPPLTFSEIFRKAAKAVDRQSIHG